MKTPLLLLVLFLLAACKTETTGRPDADNRIVVCFDHYNPRPFMTKGGARHLPMPMVGYVNEAGEYVTLTPDTIADTLTLCPTEEFMELALSYRHFEYAYFTLLKGDTITVSMDSLDYPVLRSKHFPERNGWYSLNNRLRQGRTHEGLEAKTCLGSDAWVTIARHIDELKKIHPAILESYCPLDSLSARFEDYRKAYTDTLRMYLEAGRISEEMYRHHAFLLRLKEHESRRILQEDTAYYRQLEPEITDENIAYPSYREFLGYYIQYMCKHIPYIREKQGSTADWRLLFDELSRKPFQPRSKHLLLEQCIRNISESFSADDINTYLDKYLTLTQDTLLYDQIRERYHLSADSNLLELQDTEGGTTDLQSLLKKYKGKVVYVDFWASWCAPCRREMKASRELRKRYEGKEVVFVYLALHDEEEKWLKAIGEEGLSGAENYLVLNEKNSQFIKQAEVNLIPRYILFDKEGKLVEMNAPRPSEERTSSVLERYLH